MQRPKKHALVVDDSATARAILQRMLEEYELSANTAVSAEDALDYLREARPDVIFMDHMMPGMDGLEAVRIIKQDPSTAMIPIMMYTSKGGEVYVSEARALGAVGVLSKEVKPVELLQVLRTLRLIDDPNHSRGGQSANDSTRPDPATMESANRLEDAAHNAMDAYSLAPVRRAIKVELAEHRGWLNKELSVNSEQVARKVANEVYERLLVEADLLSPGRFDFMKSGLAAVLGAVLIFGLIHILAATEGGSRGITDDQYARLMTLVDARQLANHSHQSAFPQARPGLSARERVLYDTLAWSLNGVSQVPYDQMILGERTLRTLQGLLPRLAAMGYQGTVRLDTHVGQFCLRRNVFDGMELPDDKAPLSGCRIRMLSREESRALGAQQSLAFANFLATSPVLNSGDIRIEIVSHGTERPVVSPPPKDAVHTAGEWNRIAYLNNRVEISFIPHGG